MTVDAVSAGLAILLASQLLLAVAVVRRFGRLAANTIIPRSKEPVPLALSVIIPVLNEESRILPCLEAVLVEADGTREIVEILVVDGGSTDRTAEIVQGLAHTHERLVLVDASPVPQSAAGKAWGLFVGLARARGDWVLTLDADSIVQPGLARSLAAFVLRTEVDALSVATRQSAPGPLHSLLHPSFLTTLVYRFGPPGFVTRDPRSVLANGQCFFASKAALEASGAFRSALSSLCEDVTIARTLARSGHAVGFFEAEVPVDVEMYSCAQELWANWPRSLAMRDRYFDLRSACRLASVFLVQAAPLPLTVAAVLAGLPLWFAAGQAILLAMRLGVLAGTRRGYSRVAPTFWLSPLADLPAAVRVLQMTLKRRFVWRGRAYVRGEDGSVHAVEGPAGRGGGSPSPSDSGFGT